MEKQNKKGPIFLYVFGAIVSIASYILVKEIFFREPSFDIVMIEAVNEINKSCPLIVDSETRLDNAMVSPGNILQYNYTLVNITKEEVDTTEMHKGLDQEIINNVKTNPDMEIYRKNKVTMAYYYKDRNGVYLMRLSVTPEMYR